MISALVIAALSVSPVASAHTSLLSQSPEDGSVLTELTDVRLEFSDELLDLGNSVTLTDAEGVATELPIDLSEPKVLTAPMPEGLPASEYVLEWRVVASDGHPLESSTSFTYAPADVGPTAAATPSPSPSASPPSGSTEAAAPSAEPSPSVSASAAPISAPTDDDADGESSQSALWWVLGIGLVLGILIGYMMWRKGRGPVDSDDEATRAAPDDAAAGNDTDGGR